MFHIMANSISIGRDNRNDICVPRQFETVSNNHADIEYNNEKFYLIDHSTNGTRVNGEKVKNSRVEITNGDDIKLAGSYSITWDEISHFLPVSNSQTVSMHGGNEIIPGRTTELHNTLNYLGNGNQPNIINRIMFQEEEKRKVEIAKKSWSWGAFLLGWIWAVGHRCWWPLLTIIGTYIVILLVSVFSPMAGVVLIYISNLGFFIMWIYLCVRGNSIAWDNGCFDNVGHFHQKEHNWTIAGLIVLGVSLLFGILAFVYLASYFGAVIS